jgi:hypothetical protein
MWQTGDVHLEVLISENDSISFATFYNPSLPRV